MENWTCLLLSSCWFVSVSPLWKWEFCNVELREENVFYLQPKAPEPQPQKFCFSRFLFRAASSVEIQTHFARVVLSNVQINTYDLHKHEIASLRSKKQKKKISKEQIKFFYRGLKEVKHFKRVFPLFLINTEHLGRKAWDQTLGTLWIWKWCLWKSDTLSHTRTHVHTVGLKVLSRRRRV